MKLGQQIMIARRNKKLKQSELAKKIGISNVQISNIERGKSNPRIDTLKLISKVLETSFNIC